ASYFGQRGAGCRSTAIRRSGLLPNPTIQQSEYETAYYNRKGLGQPCSGRARGSAGAALHRSAPGARSNFATGVRRAAEARTQGPAARLDDRNDRSFNADDAARTADPG